MMDPFIVYNAVAFTVLIVVCLIVYASSTDRDFTGYQPYLWVACLCLCLFGISLMWLPFGSSLYSALGVEHIYCIKVQALLFSIYLVSDTQMIIGGKKQYEVGIDDYVYAALML